ncbi:MAG: M23 family metallopeptidase [Kofleriaceae bacterium]
MKPRLSISIGAIAMLGLATSIAAAEPTVRLSPKTARPGDAVLVTVTRTKTTPEGKAAGNPLQFFRSKSGYQAVFAVPLVDAPDTVDVEVTGAKQPASIKVLAITFPDSKLVVDDELANPPPAERDRIDADNKAIITATRKADGEPQFTRGFQRPAGKITSGFGDWRTFNDGHKSQHLGLDVAAREGTPAKAINAGTVALVHDGFLAGKLVVIAHGGGVASAYYHLSEITVAEGDVVKAGAQVGLVGKTGRATGPHLHVTVRVPGGFVDPARFFKLALTPTPPKKLAATKAP